MADYYKGKLKKVDGGHQQLPVDMARKSDHNSLRGKHVNVNDRPSKKGMRATHRRGSRR